VAQSNEVTIAHGTMLCQKQDTFEYGNKTLDIASTRRVSQLLRVYVRKPELRKQSQFKV
jgi:hypothetical protein